MYAVEKGDTETWKEEGVLSGIAVACIRAWKHVINHDNTATSVSSSSREPIVGGSVRQCKAAGEQYQ